MANQPKRYKKFVATAATATLVASAIAPVASASFKDVADNNDHKKNIEAIAELGYMGAGDNFRPSENVTRGQVAIILANWAQDVAGLEVPADYKDVQRFKDVPLTADDKLLQSAALVKEYGIFEGSNGNLNGASPISREHMALVLNKAYEAVTGTSLVELAGDTSDVTFADEASINKDYLHVVKALKKLGITAPASFNPKGSVTRGQFASFFVQTVNAEEPVDETELKVESVSAINAKTLEVKFGKAVDADTVLDSNGNFKSGVVSIDGTDLKTNSSYFGEFDEDNKTLTVYNKTASKWNKDDELTVEINNVKDKEANNFPKFAKVVKVTDTVAPSIVSVESVTNQDKTKEVVVKFSEPVNFTAVKVDGKIATARATEANYANEWILTTADDLEADKSYDIEFSGLKDLLGNDASTSKATVQVVKDTTKPTATASVTGEKSFELVFDKKMNTSSVDVTSVKVTVKDSNGTDKVVPLASLPQFKSDNKTLVVNLASTPFDPSKEDSKDIKVTVSGLKDSLGNTIETFTNTITLNKDVVKPTVTSVSQTPGQYDKVDVVFSEVVSKVSSSDSLDDIFKITDTEGKEVKNASGTPITVNGSTLTLDSNNKATLTLSSALPESGTYRLVVVQNKLEDSAAVANKNNAQVITFTYNAQKAPEAPQLTGTILAKTANNGVATDSSQSNRKVVINFNQDDVVRGIDNATGTYKVGAADNPLNYTLNGSQLPEGTVITFNNDDSNNSDNDSVILDFSAVDEDKLPKALTEGGKITVSVSGIKTEAGSTIAYTAEILEVADKTEAVLESAYLTKKADGSEYYITATFSEEVQGVVIGDFELTYGDSPATTINLTDSTPASVAIDSNDASKVVITIVDTTDVAEIATNIAKTFTLTTVSSPTGTDKATSPNDIEGDVSVEIVNFAR